MRYFKYSKRDFRSIVRPLKTQCMYLDRTLLTGDTNQYIPNSYIVDTFTDCVEIKQ